MSDKPIKLRVIEESAIADRAVLRLEGTDTVVMRGSESAPDICCGSCGTALIVGVPRRQVANLVLRCNACGAFNDATDLAVN